MATSRRQKFETSASLTITLASLGIGAGRVSTQINSNDTGQATSGKNVDSVLVRGHFRMGAVAPTAGKTVEFYIVRGDGASHVDGNLGTTDAAVATATIRDQLELVCAIPVTVTTAADYYFSFILYNPGEAWSIMCWNATDQALDTTAGNFYIKYEPVTDTFL